MVLEPLFERFIAQAPLSVMARATIELALSPDALDALFKQTARRGYTKQLLFSTTLDLMSLVVCGPLPHVKAAYHHLLERVPVTLKSVYEKLSHIEPVVSSALVRAVARSCAVLVGELGGACRGLLPSPYRVKILDGNHLGATQKRLKVIRGHTAGPLPGICLAVLDPASLLVTDVIPGENGNANERSLIDQVLPHVSADEVWVADRIFSTLDFFEGLAGRHAFFVVRRHGRLNYLPRGEFTAEVETERGWAGVQRAGGAQGGVAGRARRGEGPQGGIGVCHRGALVAGGSGDDGGVAAARVGAVRPAAEPRVGGVPAGLGRPGRSAYGEEVATAEADQASQPPGEGSQDAHLDVPAVDRGQGTPTGQHSETLRTP